MGIFLMENEIQYKATHDSAGKPLEGDKYYYLRLPPNIPTKGFWSVIVNDSETRLMIQTEQPWPSVHSQMKKLAIKRDGSIDIYFGPVAFVDKECNWIKTIPGKGWNMVLNIYEPLGIDVVNLWKPDKIIELMDFEKLEQFMKIHG